MSIARTATAATVATWSTVMARRGVPAWDEAAFRTLNGAPAWLAPAVWLPMQAGALGAPLATGAVLVMRGRRRDGVRIAAGGVAAWTAAKMLKRLVGRGRPGDHLTDTTLRLGSADHGLGYPSGHAAVAVTLAAGMAPLLGGRARVAATALAGVVGVSRIYVGAHYPLDVFGGWALGSVVADMTAAGDAALRSRQ